MENLTPKQQKKLQKILRLSESGNTAILEYLFEIEEAIPEITDVISRLRGEPGKDYVITDKDRKEIAQVARSLFKDEELAKKAADMIDIPFDDIAKEASTYIKLPPPEKVDYKKIKTEVLAEIELPENGKDADEGIIIEKVTSNLENNLPQHGEAFRDGLELLQGEDRLDVSAIKGLDTKLNEFKGNSSQLFFGGGVGAIKEIVAGTNVTIDNTNPQFPIVSSTGGGGGAVDSVNGQTGVVVLNPDDLDDTFTLNKFVTTADLIKLSNLSGTNTGDQNLSGLVPYTGATGGLDMGIYSLTVGAGTLIFADADFGSGFTFRNNDLTQNMAIDASTPAQLNIDTNGFYNTFDFTLPTAGRTWSFPDESGILALTASPTFTGTVTTPLLVVDNGASSTTLSINRAATNLQGNIYYKTAGVQKWDVGMQDDSTNNYIIYNRNLSATALTISTASNAASFATDVSVFGIIYGYNGIYSFNGSNDYLGVVSSGGTNKILTTAGSTNRDISIAPGNSIAMTVQVTTNNVLVPTPGNVSTAVLTTDATQTVTNKRVTKRVSTTASSATPTPNADTDDAYTITALAANATFGAPTGTPTEMQPLTIRIKDNGTARTLAFNAIYRAIGVTLPTTTVISKTMYIDMKYNLTDTKWDVLAWGVEA